MKFKSIQQRLVIMPSDASQNEMEAFFLVNIERHLANTRKGSLCKSLLERMTPYERDHAIEAVSAQSSMIKLINSKSHIKSPQYVFGFKDGVKKLTSLLVHGH